jgi:predicted DNA-binding transcriptional regulator AlpA
VSQTEELPGDDRVCSKPEVARLFACSVRSVDRLIADRELPFVQLSERRIGILQSDAREYLRARRQWRPAPGPSRDPRHVVTSEPRTP